MTSETSPNSFKHDNFLSEAFYFGVSINSPIEKEIFYTDLERFFLSSTYNLIDSRVTEGVLCWLKRYGHLLSPSKIRRLIASKVNHNPAVLGALTDFLILECRNGHQFKLLKPFSKKLKKETKLYPGPKAHKKNLLFLNYNIVTYCYKLDEDKFLLPKKHVYKKSVELRNRALFGSTVNADVASFLSYDPNSSPYKVSKSTFNHKASVFKVFADVVEAC